MKTSMVDLMNILAIFTQEIRHFCANEGCLTNVLSSYWALFTEEISHFNAKFAIKYFIQHVLTDMLVLCLGLIAEGQIYFLKHML